MNSEEILKASYEDIIFDGRNKQYGAYELRKQYERNVIMAISISTLVLLLVAFGPVILKMLQTDDNLKVVQVKLDNKVNMEEAPPLNEDLPPPPPIKLPQVEQIKFVPPKIVETVTKEEEIATIEEIKNNANVGTVTQEGEKTQIVEKVDDIVATTEKPEEPLTFVDQQPEFPGGDEALLEYITKNIKYPAQAQDLNIQGTVYVQFVVGKDGKVRDPKILKDIGGGCGQEAQRVVLMLPPWKAGKQAGKEVPVYVKMPIKFQLR